MTRIALVFAGLLAASSSVFAQTPDIDTPLLGTAGQSPRGGYRNQVEERFHVRHAEERDEHPGLLRPIRIPPAAALLDRVH